MIDDLLAREDTIFMTGSQIADWFKIIAPPVSDREGAHRR
jgi:hypothetical protein